MSGDRIKQLEEEKGNLCLDLIAANEHIEKLEAIIRKVEELRDECIAAAMDPYEDWRCTDLVVTLSNILE